MILLLDNYDSFTYNLVHYVQQCGYDCRVVMNDEMSVDEMTTIDFSAVIISPGPRTPKEAGVTLSFIEKTHCRKPLLGICLGHQALGQFFGAVLKKAGNPMHGHTSEVVFQPHPIFNNIPSTCSVMRYHSLLLENVPSPMNVIASTQDGEVMAVVHESLPLAGLQFHPESILTTHGLQIMRNWLAWAHP